MEQIFVESFDINDWIVKFRWIWNGEFQIGYITIETEIFLNGRPATVDDIKVIITSARAEVFVELADETRIVRLEITTK